MNKNNETVQGILNAIELYAESGRKASRELGEKAFTKEAIMSWVEKGVITTVPINTLFDVLRQMLFRGQPSTTEKWTRQSSRLTNG